VYSSVGCAAPPVDLFAVARHSRINRAGFRLMIQPGVLVPVEGGFELFLRDLESRDLDIEAEELKSALPPRQRFGLAHEIAHTFFYKGSKGKPAPTWVPKDSRELEKICDGAAGRILVPSNLLQREIKQELQGNQERIDSDFVRAMAARFRTSPDVMIERLRIVESENAFARCILLVRKNKGEAQVKACYMGATLLSTLRVPKIHDPLLNWFPEFPRDIVERDGNGRWDVTRRGRQLEIEKIPLGRSGDFLLQVDDPNHRAPTSR
jgi:hypothetical protein